MRMIISPAKKMRLDTDSLPKRALPQFLPQAERIKACLQRMTDEGLQQLWRCNDSIAAQNILRLREMDLRRYLTPAILAYEGIQYRYMAPGVLEAGALEFLQEHLRILSGFYGLLRPFDGVTPYRLEMQARLEIDGARDLYAYWGDRLARQLAEETELIVDLASREYSRAVIPWLPAETQVIKCTFGELQAGRLVEKGTLCKMARGEMARFLAEGKFTRPEEIKTFDRLGYRYSQGHSTAEEFVFLRGTEDGARL